MKNLNIKEKGITLVALVITIIILLILASITLSTVLGENGLIEKAKETTEKFEKEELDEQERLSDLYEQLDINNIDIESSNEVTRRELLKRIEELENENKNLNEQLNNNNFKFVEEKFLNNVYVGSVTFSNLIPGDKYLLVFVSVNSVNSGLGAENNDLTFTNVKESSKLKNTQWAGKNNACAMFLSYTIIPETNEFKSTFNPRPSYGTTVADIMRWFLYKL